MELTLIRSLLAVAEHGAIGDAAEALHISQPALTRRIQQLERELEADLVQRSGRGVALTEMGRLAVREGRAMAERFDRLKRDLAQHQRLETGVVRVGGGATAVSHLLPAAIAEFLNGHQGVRFEVREAGSREIERAVQNEELELGIVTLPVVGRDLVIRPLARDSIVLVAGSRHPFAGRQEVAAADLDGQAMVAFEGGSAIRLLIDSALRDAGVSVNVVMELRSIAAILRMVETTGSLAFVSELGAHDANVLSLTGLSVQRQLALASKRGRALSPAAEAFASQLLPAG